MSEQDTFSHEMKAFYHKSGSRHIAIDILHSKCGVRQGCVVFTDNKRFGLRVASSVLGYLHVCDTITTLFFACMWLCVFSQEYKTTMAQNEVAPASNTTSTQGATQQQQPLQPQLPPPPPFSYEYEFLDFELKYGVLQVYIRRFKVHTITILVCLVRITYSIIL